MKNTIKILSIVGTALLALTTSAHAEKGDGEGRKGKQRKLPPHIVEKFDSDGSGKIDTEEERAAVKEAMQERRAKIVEEFDADGSGKIDTEDERKAVREAMRERRGDDGPRRKGPKGGKGKGDKGGKGKKGGQ